MFHSNLSWIVEFLNKYMVSESLKFWLFEFLDFEFLDFEFLAFWISGLWYLKVIISKCTCFMWARNSKSRNSKSLKFKIQIFQKPEIQIPDIPKARNCKIQKFQKSEIQNQEKTNFFVQDVLSWNSWISKILILGVTILLGHLVNASLPLSFPSSWNQPFCYFTRQATVGKGLIVT